MGRVLAWVAGLLALPTVVFGFEQNRDCPDTLGTLIEAAFPGAVAEADGFRVTGQRIALRDAVHLPVCRRWPAHPEILLVAVPLLNDAPDPSGFDVAGDLEVMVFGPDSDAPLTRITLPRFVEDDAVTLQDLRFDTARYRLVEGRMAFGIRARVGNTSRPNPFSQTRLWLFDWQDSALVPVVAGMVVARHYGEWEAECIGVFVSVERVLDLPGAVTAGAADLRVTGTITETEVLRREETCEERRRERQETEVLRFDGQHYPLPPGLAVEDG